MGSELLMTSNRPYLIRALYEWIADNDLTPHLLVDAAHPGVCVPREYVADGRIVLNVAAGAVHGLVLGNESVSFSARFGGKPFPVELPVSAVIGIYARENGHGMLFAEEADTQPHSNAVSEVESADTGAPEPPDGTGEKRKRPSLHVVK
jgi:stringent starvation protein B